MDAVEGPRVVCLCGSLRFWDLFLSERRRLTALGVIVLAPEETGEEPTPSTRAALGELHLRRTDLADEVRVVSAGGYVGPVTRRELEYAREKRKVISTVEPALRLEDTGPAAHCLTQSETAQTSWRKVSLKGRLTVVTGPHPPDALCFPSSRVQVLHWDVAAPFSDSGTHLHRDSDEVYVVLEGAIDLVVDGSLLTVEAGEAVTVGAGVPHALTAVHDAASGLTIRGPAVDDKVITG